MASSLPLGVLLFSRPGASARTKMGLDADAPAARKPLERPYELHSVHRARVEKDRIALGTIDNRGGTDEPAEQSGKVAEDEQAAYCSTEWCDATNNDWCVVNSTAESGGAPARGTRRTPTQRPRRERAYAARSTMLSSPSAGTLSSLLDEQGGGGVSRASKWVRKRSWSRMLFLSSPSICSRKAPSASTARYA